MRVRSLAPGLAAAGVLAASGCGSDGTATVTVTTGGTSTVAGGPTTTVASPPSTTGRRPVTTTVTRTATRTTRAPSPVARTVVTTSTRPAPTTTAGPADDVDPVDGTVPTSGRVRGNGYSVSVPSGWADGARRFEGDENAFDLNFVKRGGTGPGSVIFTDRSRPDGAAGQSLDEVAEALQADLLQRIPTARITPGPDLRVDGEDAVSFNVRRTLGGTREVRQRQIAVLRGPVLVTIRLTALANEFPADRLVFDRFLDSWRWG